MCRVIYNKSLYSKISFTKSLIYYGGIVFKKEDKLEIDFAEFSHNLLLPNWQKVYELFKNKFRYLYINHENYCISPSIFKNKHYVDFFIDYKLKLIEYDLYEDSIHHDMNYNISIIIPIYNNETLIHRTLMSIENQSFNFEEIEVLMINDASTDNTSKIINQYADQYPNFKAIHIKDGTGSAGTPRNLGLKLASADYVMFLDHDDFLEIDALEKLYNKITEYDCDIVYGTYALIDGDKPIKFIYPNEKHGFFKSLEDNPDAITTPPSIWTKLFKKEFLIKNNILFPTILGEDAIFIAKALKHANGVYYLWDDIICYYNLNEQSYTSQLSYNYFVEGFTSEEYLFNLFCDWNHEEYYSLRGQGILDYYINRFMLSSLTNDEIINLMPLFKEFCQRMYKLNIVPKTERNKTVFNHVLSDDIRNLIKLKNYKPNKIKVFSNKLLNKINKHSFW